MVSPPPSHPHYYPLAPLRCSPTPQNLHHSSEAGGLVVGESTGQPLICAARRLSLQLDDRGERGFNSGEVLILAKLTPLHFPSTPAQCGYHTEKLTGPRADQPRLAVSGSGRPGHANVGANLGCEPASDVKKATCHEIC
ncbi:unnamed protein product [Eretmochelys imbricata]